MASPINFGDPGAEGLSQLTVQALSQDPTRPALRSAEEVIRPSQLEDSDAPAPSVAVGTAAQGSNNCFPQNFFSLDGLHADTMPLLPMPAAQSYLNHGPLLMGHFAGVPAPVDSPEPRAPKEAPKRVQRDSKGQARRKAPRGPMDEMRQLVRILCKMLPESTQYLSMGDCGVEGGGNRISEEQIKHYLKTTLGEAVGPVWGLPDGGWNRFLSDLFEWATGREVDPEDARKCFKRDAGRPWEAVWPKLHELGLFTNKWPLPLRKAEIAAVQLVAQQTVGEEEMDISHTAAKRGRGATSAPDRPATLKKRRGRSPKDQNVAPAASRPLSAPAGSAHAEPSLLAKWEAIERQVNQILSTPHATPSPEVAAVQGRVLLAVCQAADKSPATLGMGVSQTMTSPAFGHDFSAQQQERLTHPLLIDAAAGALHREKVPDVWCRSEGGVEVVCIRKQAIDAASSAAAATAGVSAPTAGGPAGASVDPSLLQALITPFLDSVQESLRNGLQAALRSIHSSAVAPSLTATAASLGGTAHTSLNNPSASSLTQNGAMHLASDPSWNNSAEAPAVHTARGGFANGAAPQAAEQCANAVNALRTRHSSAPATVTDLHGHPATSADGLGPLSLLTMSPAQGGPPASSIALIGSPPFQSSGQAVLNNRDGQAAGALAGANDALKLEGLDRPKPAAMRNLSAQTLQGAAADDGTLSDAGGSAPPFDLLAAMPDSQGIGSQWDAQCTPDDWKLQLLSQSQDAQGIQGLLQGSQ